MDFEKLPLFLSISDGHSTEHNFKTSFSFVYCHPSLVTSEKTKACMFILYLFEACSCLCQSVASFQGNVSNVIVGPPFAQEANEG